ncbi:histone acetyltransferase type B catalytic subunit [Culicoides brevitarsis]|uniref:histone acetyltransferase type B catalytic subunit n=1 Tax=Culicoides brevitarsis TaxID=469753 RepID=UPI00307B16EE
MAQISQLGQFVSNALEVVEFKLLRDGQAIEDAESFHPDMAHQIFGEKENIFGYKDLKIQLFYAAGPFDVCLQQSYSKKIDDLKLDGMKADEIEAPIAELMPGGCIFTNLEEFKTQIAKKTAEFKPMGDKVMDFTLKNDSPGGPAPREFVIHRCTLETPGFVKFHAKLESIIFWFVDAASHIVHDHQWDFFLVFEKYKNPKGEERFATVGFTSVYKFYSYPEKIRPRISQMMILPPFQRLGIGSKLIESLYSYYGAEENVTDITVEEPSDIFQNMRSAVDAKLCKNLASFAPEKLKQGLSKEMLEEAKAKYKINPKQCRVVYEILRLGATDRSNPQEYKEYRLEIKKRLNMFYAKQKRDLARAEKRGVNVANARAMLPSEEQHIEQLQLEYKAIEEMYSEILKKVNQQV